MKLWHLDNDYVLVENFLKNVSNGHDFLTSLALTSVQTEKSHNEIYEAIARQVGYKNLNESISEIALRYGKNKTK